MKRHWLFTLIPAVVGAIIVLLVNLGVGIPWTRVEGSINPRLTIAIAATMSTWGFTVGIVLSTILITVAQLWSWRIRTQTKLEDQKSQASAERREFLQRLDHELKNPLTALRAGLANFSSIDSPPSGSQIKILNSIEEQAIRLSRLTADLRKISELENRPLDQYPLDIGQLLEEVFELIQDQPVARQRKLNLNIPQAPRPLPRLMGDWDLLILAFYNLLDNALKFTKPNDAIDLRAREEGEFVSVEIADTGPGIQAEDLPHLWEALYRGDAGRNVAGSGLGLALVKAIVERHEGSIDLDSHPGQGTSVTVRLPIRDD
ncbi:HAMP domain-containing histidine kinase [Chloroflexi bacterium TSY]|nr:HAMP domain-containing histidine kinase [Chloroflexi bacterium TSY]